MCSQVHGGIPKVFRITVSEKLLSEIIDCMRLTVLANFKRISKDEQDSGIRDLKEIRGRVEVIKAMMLVAWDFKHYSHGFYAEVSKKIEEISKQAASWEKWLKNRTGTVAG